MTSVEEQAVLDRLDVSRETQERLRLFRQNLLRWNKTINLVSKASEQDIWTRHILDSAQLYDLAGSKRKQWLDLGTGGGFPGLIVAIIALDRGDAVDVTCIEADVRKASFLRTTATQLGVPLKVVSRRIEDTTPQSADILSARALAPLPQLFLHAERHLAPSGLCLFLKGRSWQQEVDEALANWSFSMDTHPSMTTPESVILKIGDIKRV